MLREKQIARRPAKPTSNYANDPTVKATASNWIKVLVFKNCLIQCLEKPKIIISKVINQTILTQLYMFWDICSKVVTDSLLEQTLLSKILVMTVTSQLIDLRSSATLC